MDAIDACVPAMLRPVKARLADELEVEAEEVTDEFYLHWFAASVGSQVAKWRQLRFLHDYHQPGVSRWRPEHLYTLGENNVTLLAEFPDLDTGVFVDDDENCLQRTIQLSGKDVVALRDQFSRFHSRDCNAAEVVVRTLALLVCRDSPGTVTSAINAFRRAYSGG
jgi:hypothetical protein